MIQIEFDPDQGPASALAIHSQAARTSDGRATWRIVVADKVDFRPLWRAAGMLGAVMDILSTLYVNDAAEPSEAAGDAVPRTVLAQIDRKFSEADCAAYLRAAGLRPTRQRVALAWLLFGRGEHHVTAEMLFAEAVRAGIRISQATVYNTLNQLTKAGLLQRIGPDGSHSFFDTDATVHPHFFLDDKRILLDIPDPDGLLDRIPQPLPGHEISRVDVIVHLRRKSA